MKKLLCAAFFLLSVLIVQAQTKEQDLLTLFELTETRALAGQIFEMFIPQFERIAPDVPADYWNKVRELVSQEDFVALLLPLYDKYYTHEEVRDLVKFYESPVGKKTAL